MSMKAEGGIALNPLKESFTYPGNPRRIFIALFGISAGLTVIWYTAMFSGLSFLKGPMKVDDTAAEIIVGVAAALGMGFFVIAGKLSDRIGRKKRSEEHTSELQSLMRISYAVFCLKKKKTHN